jgi:hypothetical protein
MSNGAGGYNSQQYTRSRVHGVGVRDRQLKILPLDPRDCDINHREHLFERLLHVSSRAALAGEIAGAAGDNHTSFFGNHECRDDHIGLTIVFKRNRHPRAMVPFGQING